MVTFLKYEFCVSVLHISKRKLKDWNPVYRLHCKNKQAVHL